jgi:AcrR family transcriptional regulator
VPSVGRRSGHGDTRTGIIEVARVQFAENGYNQSTLRAIARRAGVDPALIHHYFADKAQLFIETIQLPPDPYEAEQESSPPGQLFEGAQLVERFLAQCEDGNDANSSNSFLLMVQAVSSSPEVATAVREFLADRLRLHRPEECDPTVWQLRRSLVFSHLVGLAWTRYVMRIEPLASAKRAQVAKWAGPSLDAYLYGELA